MKFDHRCTRCNEPLKPGKEVWLELDNSDNHYTDGPVPEEHSQGGFPFGAACAKRSVGKFVVDVDHNHRGEK